MKMYALFRGSETDNVFVGCFSNYKDIPKKIYSARREEFHYDLFEEYEEENRLFQELFQKIEDMPWLNIEEELTNICNENFEIVVFETDTYYEEGL